jgi:hypothetical protein
MARSRTALVVAILAAATGAAHAQDEFDFRLIRPVVTLSAWTTPDAELQENGTEFGSSTFLFGANIPLGSTKIHPDGKVLGHQFLLGLTASATDQEIEALPRDPRLYFGGLTLSAVVAGQKNLYLWSIGGSFAEDEDTIDDLDTRLFALGLGTYRTSPEFMFIYGAALTYIYGRELLLPAFGIAWTPNETWTVMGAVPFYWRVSQNLGEKWRMNYLLYVAGQRYRFANDGVFPGQNAIVYERQRQRFLGAEIEWRATEDLSLMAQAGFAGGRHLAFANLDEDDFSENIIDPVPYAKVTLRYAFGKSLMEQVEARMGQAGAGSGP